MVPQRVQLSQAERRKRGSLIVRMLMVIPTVKMMLMLRLLVMLMLTLMQY